MLPPSSVENVWPIRLGFVLAVATSLLATPVRAEDGAGEWQLGPIDDITELDLVDLLKMPVVESASRRRQSLDEAPSALEVFEHDEIVAAGLTSLAAILRRVPGLFVTETNANGFDVGMRGVHELANNRVLVLVNGRRLSDFDKASPSWQYLPLHVGEIERIEVLRGPGTLLYGADAVSGVINITTRRPLDNVGVEAIFAGGETWLPDLPADWQADRVQNLGNGYATCSVSDQKNRLGLSLTAGWSHVPNWTPADASSLEHNGDFGYHLGSSLDWRPNPRSSLFVDARAVQSEGMRTLDSMIDKRISSYGSEQAATLVFRRDELVLPGLALTVNADARRAFGATTMLVPRNYFAPVSDTNPADAVVRAEPTNYRGHLLAQVDADLLHGRSSLSLAGESTYQVTNNFSVPTASQANYAFVAQSETRFHRLIVNLGFRAEQDNLDLGDRGQSRHFDLSPRLSVIARLGKDHSLRVSAASAYREPTLWEVTDLANDKATDSWPGAGLYIKRGNLSLEPEEVRSLELGYRGRPVRWLRADLTAYLEQLRNPIGFERTQLPFAYENGSSHTQTGLELGLKARPSTVLGTHLSYAFTQRLSGPDGQARVFPTHLLQLGGDVSKRGYRLNLDFSYASTIQTRLLVPTVSGPTAVSGTSANQLLLNARVGKQLLHGSAELFVLGSNLLATVRSRGALVQYPYSAADPIGMVLLVGIAVHDRSALP